MIGRGERLFTAGWHLFLTVIHFQEIKRHHTKTGKFLSFGAAVWHLDATINDFRGTETYLRRGFKKVAGGLSRLAVRKTGRLADAMAHEGLAAEAR